jgi:NAD(P)-dependent dehydrogenase (short-subunit alcohol dehydrogenase family)
VGESAGGVVAPGARDVRAARRPDARAVVRGPRFDGRVSLVTGGGRGIGRAIALGLHAEGATVAVAARTGWQCEEVAGQMGARGLALELDVTDADRCEAAVAEVVRRFGRLDLLVNAAGISPVRQRAEVHDPAAWRAILDVNVTGAFLVTRAAAPWLLEGRGAVVNVASALAATASPRLAAYGASKAALVQLTRTLAREWADRGVRVNALCPGYVETDMTAPMLAIERLRDEVVRATPLGRVATVGEVVGPALFLASDEASYVTGAALLVDGGLAA